MQTLNRIQKELKAPKGQFNKFGGYRYRSCEDILEAVKPLLGTAVLTLSDDIIGEGGRVYVRATATLRDGNESTTVTAFAREADTKKGMDESQITGTAQATTPATPHKAMSSSTSPTSTTTMSTAPSH